MLSISRSAGQTLFERHVHAPGFLRSGAPGNQTIRIRRASAHPVDGSPSDFITVRTPLVVEFEYWKLVPQMRLDLGAGVYNEHGTLIFSTGSYSEPAAKAGLLRSWFVIP